MAKVQNKSRGRKLARNQQKAEKQEVFVVLKGIVGFPNDKGEIEDILPYKMNKDGVPVRDDSQSLIWERTELKIHPSKVGHLVANGSLILASEYEKFYGDGDGGEAENPDQA